MPRFMPNERQAACSAFGRAGEHRADFAGGGEQLGGLGADDGEIFVLGGGGILGGGELHHLAFGDHGRGGREDFERAQTSRPRPSS